MISKIKKIKDYMKTMPVPMTEIGVIEAAQIADSTEEKICAHLSGSIWFKITDKKGVYKLLDYPRKYKSKKKLLEEKESKIEKPKTNKYGREKENKSTGYKTRDKNGNWIDYELPELKTDSEKEKQNITITPKQPAIDSKPEHSSDDELILKMNNIPDTGVPLNKYFEEKNTIDEDKSLKIITKKTHYCPHCKKEILI